MSTEHQHTDPSATGGQPRLLSEFAYPTYEEWHEAAVKLLKGAPFDKKMYAKTYEGVTLKPMYLPKDVEDLTHTDSLPGFAPYVRGGSVSGYTQRAWDVAQETPYSTPQECQRALENDLERGQTAVNLKLDPPTRRGDDPDKAEERVGCGGVSIATVEDLEKTLEGVDLAQTPLHIQGGAAAASLLAFLATLAEKRGIALESLSGGITMDPLNMLAVEGTLPTSLATLYKKMAGITAWAAGHAPQLKTVAVDATPYHNSGANAVQELAYAVASGVEYLRAVQALGVSVDQAAPRMTFTFASGSNYFMEIAKLRAARLFWAKIVKAFGGSDEAQNMTIHVRTSTWNKTVHDPYVNMLRTTVESFAGVVGGCDSMHIGCFDEPIRVPDDFSRRIARNTHIILKDETHLDEVIDPAGGSWYVERLTDDLARSAWNLFQEIEQQGGMAKALETGIPQQQAEQIAQQRKANLSTRKAAMIGTNMYPNLSEKTLAARDVDYQVVRQARADYIANYRLTQGGNVASIVSDKLAKLLQSSPAAIMETMIEAASSGATLGDLEHGLRLADETAPTVEPLRIHRGAEMFETLRAATETHLSKTGARPQIFMANMGPIPQHKARADFSVGFFEVGGFEMLNNDGFATVDDAAEAALASGAAAVIICSTDASYPDIVPALTQKIKAAKPETTIILAGYPKEHVDAFKQAGVDEFIHIRANLYDIVVRLLNKLGILD